MRVFVFKRKSLVFYGIMIIAALTVLITRWDSTTSVFNNNTELNGLPIYCVDKGEEKICAISFDAAWGNEDTPVLIDVLKQYNVKTTFFVVGSWVDKYPESVKALHDAGHEIMNHSNSHPHMTQISKETALKEIKDCDDKIEKITGVRPILFRPPYGDYNSAVVDILNESKHYCMQWSVDSLDWKDLTAQEIYNRVTQNLHPGAIVLFHNAAKHTPEALPNILKYCKDSGYKVVPVSELIYKDNYTIDHTGKQILKSSGTVNPDQSATSDSNSKKSLKK